MDPGSTQGNALEQQQAFWGRETGLERAALAQIERASTLPQAIIISGLRRTGTSSLLADPHTAHTQRRQGHIYLGRSSGVVTVVQFWR